MWGVNVLVCVVMYNFNICKQELREGLGNNAYLGIWVVKEFSRFSISSKWDPLFMDLLLELVDEISYI